MSSSRTVDLKEARDQLAALVDQASRGDEVVLTDHGEPVARIVAVARQGRRREFGSAKGKITIGPDFDAPIEELSDYR
jgi:prevent-host-death family protein